MAKHTFICEEKRTRLDKWLTNQTEWSRSLIQQWIQDGHVAVNGEPVKSNYKMQLGDEVVVDEPEVKELEVKAEPLDLDIIYEDRDVLVVNKPRGMVVHPAPGHASGTLVNGLMAHCQDLSGINGVLRPGIVHRIDKDTSGLLMVAKNDLAHESLVEQLKNKTTKRRYEALVSGVIPHDKGTIDAPIGRDPEDRQRMTVTDMHARDAVTHFQVIERFANYTHVACELETGRTHQIRAHMKYIGYPIVGDPKYGSRKKHAFPINGQALHAELLGFVHPRTGEDMLFRAPLPDDLKDCLDQAGRK
ncbi:RluA family pseudouridine synthase [Salipaludibacillus sp. LMS25]|jgi:23S rRNA pseudouridine1911/1915/1917 synthase|uniref:RluA family pseudouridine synthase n=1 Tax=Salipaludibacillus sp. LMS25 TaxID=2924031 RepID=UPI0020D11481|nr:RluA family pseudouridine synthase [Salipaludibacillus sp. LMS25]UTR15168.1 RluA family pseudouridine synthase [Salipaludibacillus sp. LMS25]